MRTNDSSLLSDQGSGSFGGYGSDDGALGMQEVMKLGIQMEEILPTLVTIQVVNGITDPVVGMTIVVISYRNKIGLWKEMRQQAYVMKGANQLYLSQEALEELGYIKKEETMRWAEERRYEVVEREEEEGFLREVREMKHMETEERIDAEERRYK